MQPVAFLPAKNITVGKETDGDCGKQWKKDSGAIILNWRWEVIFFGGIQKPTDLKDGSQQIEEPPLCRIRCIFRGKMLR